MSNTDKAIELSNRFKCLPTCERCKNIEDACYSMAQWKDEQYKQEKQQWIDKACDVYCKDCEYIGCDKFECSALEKFRKAMEEL